MYQNLAFIRTKHYKSLAFCAYVNVVLIYLVDLPLHLDGLRKYILGASVYL